MTKSNNLASAMLAAVVLCAAADSLAGVSVAAAAGSYVVAQWEWERRYE